MLLNYLKIAFRVILRNPLFSLINILGLSLFCYVFCVMAIRVE